MHKLIDPDFNKILEIYTDEFPEFLLPFFEAKCIKRIAYISQHCGTEYNNFYNYKSNVSRLEHSLGVALIIWNFTKDIKQTLAGFFHDISHSVFSHVGDFILGDAENQEASEQYTTEILKNDEVIVRELEKLGIKIEEVDDYEIFPIADNPGPKLAADRLEYTLGTAYELGKLTNDEIKEIYENIEVLTNEKGEPELSFSDNNKALKFGYLALENDEGCFSSYESVVSMSFLSEVLKQGLKENLYTAKDLYSLTDPEIITIIEKSGSDKLKEMWEYFKNLSSYRIDRIKKDNENYYISAKCKRRYIDPLVKTKEGNIRVSNLSEDFRDRRDYHLNRREEWISLDYKI